MESDLINLSNSAVGFVSEQFPNTLKFLFNHTVKTPVWIIGGGLIVWGVSRYRTYRSLKDIRFGNFSGSEAVIGPTIYDRREVEGEEFFDQTIITDKQAFDLGQFFPTKVRKEILGVIEATDKLCTQERPSPFQHLDTVLAERKYRNSKEQIKDAIQRGWKNGISSMMRENPNFFPERFNELSGAENSRGMVIAILVKEPDAKVKQYRVFLFTEKMLRQVLDIKKEQLRVAKGRNHVCDPESTLNMRLETNQALANDFFKNQDWWEENFGVLFSWPHAATSSATHDNVAPE